MGLFTPKWMKELSEKECNKHYEVKKRQKNPFRQLLSTVAVTILVLGLSGCGTDNQARVYQAAKSKLDYAENLGGGIAAYQVENAYQEALDALDALGDYEDAPELAFMQAAHGGSTRRQKSIRAIHMRPQRHFWSGYPIIRTRPTGLY